MLCGLFQIDTKVTNNKSIKYFQYIYEEYIESDYPEIFNGYVSFSKKLQANLCKFQIMRT